MQVAELWRYPVKSMAGEPLREALLTPEGIEGDRLLHVVKGGRVITSRAHPRLLGHKAALGPGGEPLVDGMPWDSPPVAAAVERAAGSGARLVRATIRRFDVLPLLVATDGAILALAEDGRRLRPNVVVGGVEGLQEREWEGRRLRAGGAVIALRDLRQRCVMITFHPDTLEQDPGVLERIVGDFGGSMALNAEVLTQALVRVGDPVSLLAD